MPCFDESGDDDLASTTKTDYQISVNKVTLL